MNSWKKIYKTIGWLSLTVAGIALLVAAVHKEDLKTCAGVKVELSGSDSHVFMEESEILRILNSNESLIGQPVETINLRVLESRLEKDKWIKNAELFFDNNQVLQVRVEERLPIARVFTIAGSSFYIDSAGKKLPLSDVSIRVPMFTSFPAIGNKMVKSDSVLLIAIREIATYINMQDFWKAQVSQVDITPHRTFEMIPTIGNHVVRFGKGTDVKEKFERLYTFYKQVWTKVGLERYASIDVQFKDQVIATRKGVWTNKVDSAEVKKAFETMMKSNKPDTVETVAVQSNLLAEQANTKLKRIEHNAHQVVANTKETKLKVVAKNESLKRVPKAVMHKKD